jgi:enoyl-CoA hydratase/carnithine racemase
MATGAQPRVDVRLERREAGVVAYLTIDNAAKLNVLGRALMAEFTAQVAALAAHEDLRAMVLTGAGNRAFIGGANIDEMARLDAAGAREFITALHRVCAAVWDLPVPAIARINGYALGGGLEVAAACDIRVAAANAVFGMPEVRVGLPSVIEAALLPGLIGWGRTRELLLLGETIDAETALRWGLVQRVVPAEDLDAAVEACLGALLSAGPRALRLQKQLIRQWGDLSVSQAVAAGIDAFVEAYASDEPSRMMRAFLERGHR